MTSGSHVNPDDEVADAVILGVGDEAGQDGPRPNVANIAGSEVVHVTPGLMEPVASMTKIREAFSAYVDVAAAITDERDDYQVVGGKKFPKKSALRKLGTAFGVSSEIVSKEIHRDERGQVQWAEFIVRAFAPSGRSTEGFGECSLWDKCEPAKAKCKADDHNPASHFSHPNHDIPSTAETRARNRAFSELFAMGQVSAEEASEPELWEDLGWPSATGFRALMDPLHAALKSNPDLAAEWKQWRASNDVAWPVRRTDSRAVRIWMQERHVGDLEHGYEEARPAGEVEGPVPTPGTDGTSSSAAPPGSASAGESPGTVGSRSRAGAHGKGGGDGESHPARDEPSPPPPSDRSGTASKAQLQRLAIMCNELAATTMNTADLSNDDFRHAVVDAATLGAKQKATTLTKRECAHVIDVAGKLERGEVKLVLVGEVDGRLAELA